MDHSTDNLSVVSCIRTAKMRIVKSAEERKSEILDVAEQLFAENTLNLEDIAYLTCRGGWPRATLQKKDVALGRAFDYFDAVIKRDIVR